MGARLLNTPQCGNTNPIAWNIDDSLLAFTTQSGGNQQFTYNSLLQFFETNIGEIGNTISVSENEVSFISELEWQPNVDNITFRKYLETTQTDGVTCIQQIVEIVNLDGQKLLRFEGTENNICGDL
jgi:hypothetical protein